MSARLSERHQELTGDRPTAVVLGLGQNGMATCRALGRVGIPVIGIDTDLEQPSARTRYARKVHCPDFLSGGPGLVDCLLEIGRELSDKGVLFPSGDLNLAVVSEHRERLGDYFHIALPAKDVVRMFLNKKLFYQLAIDKGFPLPATFFPAGPEELREIAGRLAYPCLIKPFQPNDAWRKTFDTRLFVANSAGALVALYDHLVQVHEDLIVQEYMPGADSESGGASAISMRQEGPSPSGRGGSSASIRAGSARPPSPRAAGTPTSLGRQRPFCRRWTIAATASSSSSATGATAASRSPR